MGRLTTHVLDAAHGRPGQGIRIEVYAIDGEARRLVKTTETNHDGRVDQPLLEGDALLAGEYELLFHVGDYYRALNVAAPEPRFLDKVALRFGVAKPDEHYHVPLLVSPYSYSTYRGS